jgi:hypothetical protein
MVGGMTPAQLESAERTAFEQFVAAVLALSDDPEPANVERYLEASRALERSREAFDRHRGRALAPKARARVRRVRRMPEAATGDA